MEQPELWNTACKECKMTQPLGGRCFGNSNKIKQIYIYPMTQRFDSLGREINIHVHKKTHMCRWTHNNPKMEIIQMSINRSMNKLLFSYNGTIDTCNNVDQFQKH